MSQMEFLFAEERVSRGKHVRRVFSATEFQFERTNVEPNQVRVFRVFATGPVVGDLAIRVSSPPAE